jgi:hypothetical protein
MNITLLKTATHETKPWDRRRTRTEYKYEENYNKILRTRD